MLLLLLLTTLPCVPPQHAFQLNPTIPPPLLGVPSTPAPNPTWQLLQRHVMHHLVIAALQEAGVYGAEGRHALAGQAGGKCDGVLLSNAHVIGALGEVLLKAVQAWQGWQRRLEGWVNGVQAWGGKGEGWAEEGWDWAHKASWLSLGDCRELQPQQQAAKSGDYPGKSAAAVSLHTAPLKYSNNCGPSACYLPQGVPPL